MLWRRLWVERAVGPEKAKNGQACLLRRLVDQRLNERSEGHVECSALWITDEKRRRRTQQVPGVDENCTTIHLPPSPKRCCERPPHSPRATYPSPRRLACESAARPIAIEYTIAS